MNNEDLQKAIMLVKSNRKKEAQLLFSEIVKKEPKNELAWSWLSACVETDEQKIFCLKKVIEINPRNNNAKLALERLSSLPQPTIDDIVPSNQNISPQQPPININITQPQVKEENKSAPVGLIVLVWIFVVLSFFTSGLASILLAISIIIGAVFLMANSNRTAKINGFIIGILWLFTCIIGYIQGMNNY